jgi:hypothetical protein
MLLDIDLEDNPLTILASVDCMLLLLSALLGSVIEHLLATEINSSLEMMFEARQDWRAAITSVCSNRRNRQLGQAELDVARKVDDNN